MIPKKIHYVWVGGAPKSELTLRCIESWKKYMPDYEIIEWNENNFDVNMFPFVKEAYQQKKWAFVSDVIRTYALYNEGGVYFDADLELIRDPNKMFESSEVVLGYETDWLLAGHVMATVKGHKIFEELLSQYKTENFVCENGLNEKTITHRISIIVFKYLGKRYLPSGTYKIKDVQLLDKQIITGRQRTEQTVCVHHFNGSWKPESQFTSWQWFVLRVRNKLDAIFFRLRGNIRTINANEKLWLKARKRGSKRKKGKTKKI